MAGVSFAVCTWVTALMTYVPVHLGVAHQAGALSTWTAAVVAVHTCY